jgi:hypothetical protein
MSEFRKLSKLPSDPGYWDRLERRITGELGAEVRALPDARPEWWAPLARGALAIGGLAAAAAVAALLFLPPRPAATPSTTGFLRSPDNPTLVAFFASSEAPPLATLLVPAGRTR